MTLKATIVLVSACSVVAPAPGQCPDGWLPGEGVNGVDGSVRATTSWDPDGDGPQRDLLVAGGTFSVAGSVMTSNIAVWDGATWQALGTGISGGLVPNHGVHALTVYTGDLIGGGEFTTAGGSPASSIARWDGSTWQAFGAGMNGRVTSLAVFEGELIAGGSFTMAGNVDAMSIARWDGEAWHALGSGLSLSLPNCPECSAIVNDMAVFNGDLIACGWFNAAGGMRANGVARWDGIDWHAVGSLGDAAPVNALAVYDNDLIAGGGFCVCNPKECVHGIFRWNGTDWQALDSGFLPAVRDLAVWNHELIAFRRQFSWGCAFPLSLERWDGEGWSEMPAPAGLLRSASLSVHNGQLLLCGENGIASWNGEAWRTHGAGTNGVVLAMTPFEDDVIAGGEFTRIGGAPANCVARWNGNDWQPLGNGMSGAFWVQALTTHDGDLIAAGLYSSFPLGLVSDVARWDGAAWQPYGSQLPGHVHALLEYNGELIAGGDQSVVRWNGAAWQPLGVGMNSVVYALAVCNGDLIAGGSFSSAGGSPAQCVARWNGSSWQPLGGGMEQYDHVYALTVHDGQLIAGGSFSTAGGVPANNVARWNGAAWEALGDGIATHVRAFSTHAMDLIAGGFFITAGGVPANNVARWNGANWQPLGTGTNDGVMALAVHDGELHLGGLFTIAGDGVSAYVARWGPVCPLGDINADGVVDIDDLLAVIAAWGPCPAPPAECNADIAPTPDGDGQVNIDDLLLVISSWG